MGLCHYCFWQYKALRVTEKSIYLLESSIGIHVGVEIEKGQRCWPFKAFSLSVVFVHAP